MNVDLDVSGRRTDDAMLDRVDDGAAVDVAAVQSSNENVDATDSCSRASSMSASLLRMTPEREQ